MRLRERFRWLCWRLAEWPLRWIARRPRPAYWPASGRPRVDARRIAALESALFPQAMLFAPGSGPADLSAARTTLGFAFWAAMTPAPAVPQITLTEPAQLGDTVIKATGSPAADWVRIGNGRVWELRPVEFRPDARWGEIVLSWPLLCDWPAGTCVTGIDNPGEAEQRASEQAYERWRGHMRTGSDGPAERNPLAGTVQPSPFAPAPSPDAAPVTLVAHVPLTPRRVSRQPGGP